MKGVDGSDGRGRLQLPREKEAAAATAATGPDGERAACFLRRTKIMEFSGTTQNTPQGGTSKNKKRTFHHLFLCSLHTNKFCRLLWFAPIPPVLPRLCDTHTLSLSYAKPFFFSLMFYLFDDSFLLLSSHLLMASRAFCLSASTEDRPKYRRTCIWGLCYFSSSGFGTLWVLLLVLIFCLPALYHLVYGRFDVGVHDVCSSRKKQGWAGSTASGTNTKCLNTIKTIENNKLYVMEYDIRFVIVYCGRAITINKTNKKTR